MREADRNLTLMIQADMTAYHEPGEPQQLGFPETYVHQRVVCISKTQVDNKQHRHSRSYTARCQHFHHLCPPACRWIHPSSFSVYNCAGAELTRFSKVCCSDHQASLAPFLLPWINTDGISHLSPSISRGSLLLIYLNVQG